MPLKLSLLSTRGFFTEDPDRLRKFLIDCTALVDTSLPSQNGRPTLYDIVKLLENKAEKD